jgi:hypothetical protein
MARRIVDLVDGKRSILDICLEVHASEFTVSKLLYLLHKQEFVRVAELVRSAPAKQGRTFSELLAEAKSHVQAGRAEDALKILEEASPLSPNDITLRQLREEARACFVRQVTVSGFAPDLIPTLARPLEELTAEKISPEQVFILSRVNGTWDIRSIVSLCPFPEAEALMHIKQLKDRGILGIHKAA